MKRITTTYTMGAMGVALLAAALAPIAALADGDIKIAHIVDKTGPLEPFATDSHLGLLLGIEYATGGKNTVAGKKIQVILKDSQNKADVGKALLQEAYADDKADIAVGPTSSAVALAMLPVAKEYKKVLMIDSAAAEYLTGSKSNRYIFRTGRNSDQDGYANALVIGKKDTYIATLAPDYAFGREGINSFREAIKLTPAKLVHEEYPPVGTTDFTAYAERIFAALKDKPGRKLVWMLWAGPGNPFKILDLNPGRYGIEVVTGGNILPAMTAYKPLMGMEGATHYYFECPKNSVNDWLVREHQKRYKRPPDFFTVTGMMTGIALVKLFETTNGKTDTETMIKALAGMKFDGPKGPVYFNEDNHQLMQPMYHFKIKADESMATGVGQQCLGEVSISDMKFPIEKLK